MTVAMKTKCLLVVCAWALLAIPQPLPLRSSSEALLMPGAARAQQSLPSTASLYGALNKLFHEYYPNAKIKQEDAKMHVEYKMRMFDIPQTNTIEPGVDWGGVLCDLELQSGPYTGIEPVPRQLNQYSTYKIMVLAPYSPKYDCHLNVRLTYPFDIKPEFLERFKIMVNDFETKLFS